MLYLAFKRSYITGICMCQASKRDLFLLIQIDTSICSSEICLVIKLNSILDHKAWMNPVILALFVPKNVHGILMQLYVTTVKWCHIGCANISPSMYEKYGNTSVLWICPVCDTPNHSRTIFQSYLSWGHSLLCSNSYSLLTNNSEISLNINDNIGDPLAASSPKPPPPPRNKQNRHLNQT